MDQGNSTMSGPKVPPVVITLIVGLIVGLLAGYYLPKKQTAATQTPTTQGSQSAQAPSQAPTTPPKAPPQQEQGFYGTVISNANGRLAVQEVLSSKQNSTRTFTVATDAKTQFVYQKPAGSKDASKTPFTPEVGKFDQIKKGWFVFVSTMDTIATTTNITATQITYSEKSPFKQ